MARFAALYRLSPDDQNSAPRFQVSVRDGDDVTATAYGRPAYIAQDAFFYAKVSVENWAAAAPDPRSNAARGPYRLVAVFAPTAEEAAAALRGLYGTAVDETRPQDPWARRERHQARTAAVRAAALAWARSTVLEVVGAAALLVWAEAHAVHPAGCGGTPPTTRPVWWPSEDPTGRRQAVNGAAWTAAATSAARDLLLEVPTETRAAVVQGTLAVLSGGYPRVAADVAAAILEAGPLGPFGDADRQAVVESWARAQACIAAEAALLYRPVP